MKSKKQLEDGLFRMEELIGGAADESSASAIPPLPLDK